MMRSNQLELIANKATWFDDLIQELNNHSDHLAGDTFRIMPGNWGGWRVCHYSAGKDGVISSAPDRIFTNISEAVRYWLSHYVEAHEQKAGE